MTETNESNRPAKGWILYDAQCGFCTRLARRMGGWARRHDWSLLPLQTPWVEAKLGLNPDEPPQEMVALGTDGRRYGGAGAVIHLAREHRVLRPLAALVSRGPLRRLADRAYRWVADRRGCVGGACKLSARRPDGGSHSIEPEGGEK